MDYQEPTTAATKKKQQQQQKHGHGKVYIHFQRDGKRCSECRTVSTPLWRTVNKVIYCNACGIRRRKRPTAKPEATDEPNKQGGCSLDVLSLQEFEPQPRTAEDEQAAYSLLGLKCIRTDGDTPQ